jgi:energy-coupling factor transporter ATP-binding protein EcfA2
MATSRPCGMFPSTSPPANRRAARAERGRQDDDHQDHDRLPATRCGVVLINDLDVLERTARGASAHRLPAGECAAVPRAVGAGVSPDDGRPAPIRREQRGLLSEAIYATGLQEHLTRPIGHLSKGFRQRVGLAQAILHKPRLLILDEPTVGLDPTQIVEIRHLIRRLAEHSTVLFSTHILSEVEALCDRAIILMNGLSRPTRGWPTWRPRPTRCWCWNNAHRCERSALCRVAGRAGCSKSARWLRPTACYRVMGMGDVTCARHLQLAREHDWPLRELRRDVRTLETVFNELATGR